MKKKVLLYGLASLFVVVMGVFAVVSCTKDGTESGSGSIVGTWNGSKYTLIFNSDNTGVAVEKSSYYGERESWIFTYSMTDANQGVITLQNSDYYGDDDEIITFKVTDGSTMILYGSYADYDYEWVIDILTSQGGSSSGGGSVSSSVVGTWYGECGSSRTLTLTFNANGTGNYVEYYHDSYSGDDSESDTFTYSMTDSQNGYIYWYEDYYGTENIRFSVSGNTMCIYGEDYNYGEVVEWVLTKQR